MVDAGIDVGVPPTARRAQRMRVEVRAVDERADRTTASDRPAEADARATDRAHELVGFVVSQSSGAGAHPMRQVVAETLPHGLGAIVLRCHGPGIHGA
jgi:hypothetical protein